jgi:DNA-binding GntR family transcriptional regulator
LFSISQLVIQRTYRFRYAAIRIMEIAQITRDRHEDIVAAFEERNAEKVDRAVLAHMGEVRRKISSYLEQLRHNSLGFNPMVL